MEKPIQKRNFFKSSNGFFVGSELAFMLETHFLFFFHLRAFDDVFHHLKAICVSIQEFGSLQQGFESFFFQRNRFLDLSV